MKSKVTYSKTYRDYLKKYDLPGKEFLDHDLNRLIVGNYTTLTDTHRRPLAKLYRDIARQLGLV